MGEAMESARSTPAEPVPLHIRNAPTGLMKDLGYGQDYKYAFESEQHYLPQEYLPEKLGGRTFYEPSEFGYEKRIAERLEWWRRLRAGETEQT
jgi:putative ATPase